jgi:hypothetical protein
MKHSKEYELGYKDALCGVRFKYLPEANGEEYTRGYNAGRRELMEHYTPVSDNLETDLKRVE